jgi:hypothetical protein
VLQSLPVAVGTLYHSLFENDPKKNAIVSAKLGFMPAPARLRAMKKKGCRLSDPMALNGDARYANPVLTYEEKTFAVSCFGDFCPCTDYLSER